MDFQAIFDNYKTTITQHYFDMSGRADRAQFWYFALANVVVAIVAQILGSLFLVPLGPLYNLAVLLPVASIGARRLQDMGRNGQLVWILVILTAISQLLSILAAITFLAAGMFVLAFVPLLGFISLALLAIAVVLIWFWCQPGDAGPNAYGAQPPVFDPR